MTTADSFSDRVSVLLNDGAGGFGSAIDLPVGAALVSVTAGDFNKDGYGDLVTANVGSDDVTVLMNGGTGPAGFSVTQSPTTIGGGPESETPNAADASSTNTDNRWDINGNGQVTALDALVLVNRLDEEGVIPLSEETTRSFGSLRPDVNGDGHLSAIDPLGVINYLIRSARRTADGESTAADSSKPADPLGAPASLAGQDDDDEDDFDALLTTLSHDVQLAWNHTLRDS